MTAPSDAPTRVFLDANVLYAAALGGGSIKLWSLQGVQLVTSEYAAQEAWVNLQHAPATEECRLRLLHLLEPPIDFVAWEQGSSSLPQGALELDDPSDVPILMGALVSRCCILLTGDARCFGRYFGATLEGITILKPGKFLAMRGL
jgi:predicted nucleic acid-binding protein